VSSPARLRSASIFLVRKLLPVAWLAAAPAWASAWVSVGESETAAYYMDPEVMRADGVQRRVWRLFDYKEKQANGVQSGKALLEINCSEGSYRYLRTVYYAGSMGQGKVLGGTRDQRKEFIGPGTMIGHLAKTVCQPPGVAAPGPAPSAAAVATTPVVVPPAVASPAPSASRAR
jgi:hypothetical protein